MRRLLRLALLALVLGVLFLPQGWRALDGPGITQALTARALVYEDGARQSYLADGRTLYESGGSESWGRWWVEGGLYCSSWPPSDRKSCYQVEVQGQELRFVAGDGSASVGRYADP